MENELLKVPEKELADKLLQSTNPDDIKDIINVFNLNIQKKNIIRTSHLNELQDRVYEQMEKRLEKYPDNFSNKDLLDYYKTIQDSLSKADTNAESITKPIIQINQQNNINVTNNELSSESKRKIADVISRVVAQQQAIEFEQEAMQDD